MVSDNFLIIGWIIGIIVAVMKRPLSSRNLGKTFSSV